MTQKQTTMRHEVDMDLMTMTESPHLNTFTDRQAPEGSPTNAQSGWSRALTRPVAVGDGPELATLADVRSFLSRRLHHHPVPSSAWQRVTTLLLSAARDEIDVADVTVALEMAASTEAMRQAEPPRPVAEPATHDARRPPAAEPAQGALPAVDWTANAAKPPQLIRGSFLSKILGRSATEDRQSGETS
jgi:pterin-4a-carbinolamine dehydratase